MGATVPKFGFCDCCEGHHRDIYGDGKCDGTINVVDTKTLYASQFANKTLVRSAESSHVPQNDTARLVSDRPYRLKSAVDSRDRPYKLKSCFGCDDGANDRLDDADIPDRPHRLISSADDSTDTLDRPYRLSQGNTGYRSPHCPYRLRPTDDGTSTVSRGSGVENRRDRNVPFPAPPSLGTPKDYMVTRHHVSNPGMATLTPLPFLPPNFILSDNIISARGLTSPRDGSTDGLISPRPDGLSMREEECARWVD